MWWFFLWESIWKNRILTNILALKNKGMHAFPYVYICLIDVVISFLLQYTKWISQYNKCNIQSRSHSEVPLKIGSPKKQTESWHIFKWFYFWMKLINKELIIQGLVIIINVLFKNFAKTYMFCPFYIWTFYNNFSRIWLTNGKSDVSPLCQTWKACICFGVCILISVPFSCSVKFFLGR